MELGRAWDVVLLWIETSLWLSEVVLLDVVYSGFTAGWTCSPSDGG